MTLSFAELSARYREIARTDYKCLHDCPVERLGAR